MPLVMGFFPRVKLNRIFQKLAAPRQGALLWVLTIAVEKQLPLVPVVEALAHDMRGSWRRKIWELAGALDAGMPLADALESVPGIVPKSAILAARVGSESGTLGPALRLAAESFTAQEESAKSRILGFVFYLVIMAFAIFVITGFMMYWIVPRIKMIYSDFGLQLPRMTLFLIEASDAFVKYLALGLLAFFVLFLMAFVFKTLHLNDSTFLGLISRLLPQYRMPEVLRNLSIVVQAGRPIVSGLASLESHLTDPTFRRRISSVHIDVQAGNDVWQSMTDGKLLRPTDAALLTSAERVGNLPWALQTTADSIERRVDTRIQIFLEFFRPVAIFGLALVVGTIVIGMFMPLLKMLNAMD